MAVALFALWQTQVCAQELEDIRTSADKSKDFSTKNRVYEQTIRTVRLRLRGGLGTRDMPTPVVPFNPNRPVPLRLSFDCLSEDAQYYEVQLIHCNADWSPSSLAPIDYLDDYNEFPINDFEYSINTRVPYIHYWFDLPRVKMSGNYLIKVYHEGDEDDLVLTQRMMVHESIVEAGLQRREGNINRERQQLSLQVYYGNLSLERPRSQIKAVVRQNYRWDNAIVDLKPTFVNQMHRRLEYSPASGSLSFWAGHEFRQVDLSDLENGGFQVGRINRMEELNRVVLQKDKPREGRAYNKGLFQDRQGNYQIAVQQWDDPRVEADYAEVVFRLHTGNPLKSPVYVTGGFCNWRPYEALKMDYVPSEGIYYAVAFLKQGIYDYYYRSSGENPNAVEGNFFQAQNDYDALIYYRAFGARGDRLVGYIDNSRQRR